MLSDTSESVGNTADVKDMNLNTQLKISTRLSKNYKCTVSVIKFPSWDDMLCVKFAVMLQYVNYIPKVVRNSRVHLTAFRPPVTEEFTLGWPTKHK